MVHLGTCVLTQAQHRAVRALKGTEVVGLWDVCLSQPEARKGLISWGRGCGSLGVRFSSDPCHQPTSSDHAEPQASRKTLGGLPWWRSGGESACQCRGHGFEPWSGKIPHAAEQLGP